ncbi:MAG TPA: hypothetical protein VEI52_01665 [Terriglobales bacterium]|nr:hypothetical protein [Terriglobales bacterium]
MLRIPIFGRGQTTDDRVPPILASYVPSLLLEGLQVGVDNLRHDVHLSPKFGQQAKLHISRLLIRHGDLEGLLAASAPEKTRTQFIQSKTTDAKSQAEPSDLKSLFTELHVAVLNQAKAAENQVLDLLGRTAIIKFLRVELNAQFAQVLERCRMAMRGYEGFRHQKAYEYRERVAALQVGKKTILRKTGEELFRTLRDAEKDTLAHKRRSLFGTGGDEPYRLFLNPLMFSEDGNDARLNAEHYVMLGNFESDPDRFVNVRKIACEFLESILPAGSKDPTEFEGYFNVPENAQALVGAGLPDDSTPESRSQKSRLTDWVSLMERERVMEHIVAAYEVVPLLAEYSPQINAAQLKNALTSREERARVEKLIAEHSKLTPASLQAAIDRVAGYRGAERAKIAGRFLRDFFRYHRARRQLEVLNGALDSIQLVLDEKKQQLSAMNGTLYEFLLPQEQSLGGEKIVHHVIIKADVRDSSRLTRSLLERDMNPASYFSLNFYDPVNKLLAKYGASKVFLEGDAIILALLEREGEPGMAVGRAAVLAREIVEIERGYNQLLQRTGLPSLELGLGISYQDSPPMYLMDGDERIMISDALNLSDRLSSSSKRLRKNIDASSTPFHVFAFQTISDGEAEDSSEDFVLKYNVNGIRMSEAAFEKLQQEISLEPCRLDLPGVKAEEHSQLFSGLVSIGNDIFRKIVVRASQVPLVDPRNFTLQEWTDLWYYEVCSDPAIYAQLEAKAGAGK